MAKIEFGTFKAEAKENPYTEEVQLLAVATDEAAERGDSEVPSIVLTTNQDDAQKDQFAFQRAANAIDKTARIRRKDEHEDGTVVFEFTLTKRHQGRRKSKKATENVSEEANVTEGETSDNSENVTPIDGEDTPRRKRA